MALQLGLDTVNVLSTGVRFEHLPASRARDARNDQQIPPDAIERIASSTLQRSRGVARNEARDILIAFAREGWAVASTARGMSGARNSIRIIDTEEVAILDHSVIVRTNEVIDDANTVRQALSTELQGRLTVLPGRCVPHPYLSRYWRCAFDPTRGSRSEEAEIDALETIQKIAAERLGWQIEPFLLRDIDKRSDVPPSHDTVSSKLGVYPLNLHTAWDAMIWPAPGGTDISAGIVDLGFLEGTRPVGRGGLTIRSWLSVEAANDLVYRVGQAAGHATDRMGSLHGETCARLLAGPYDASLTGRERFAHGIAAGLPVTLVESARGSRSDWQLSIALCAAAFGDSATGSKPCDLISCSIGDNTGRGWTPNGVLIDAITAITGQAHNGAVVDARDMLRPEGLRALAFRETRPVFWAVDNRASDVEKDKVVSHEGVTSIRGADLSPMRLPDGTSTNRVVASSGASGPKLDLLAPAKGNILMIEGRVTTAKLSNSYATPIAAGIAALVMHILPGWDARRVARLLDDTADRPVLDEHGRSYGIVDAGAAIKLALHRARVG